MVRAQAQCLAEEAQRCAVRLQAEREQQARALADAEREEQARALAEAEREERARALVEAERLAAERKEALRLEAEQRAREQAEAQRAEEARLRAERIEAERRAQAQAEAERARIEAARAEALRQAQAQAAHERREAEAASARAGREGDQATPPAAPSGALPLVMVADDSKVVRVKTSRLLAARGFRVALAEDGAQALEMIGKELPQVLVTDVEMPHLDGLDLTRRLRADLRTAELPVIMITSADDRLADVAREAGVTVLMGKPYGEQDFVAQVARLAGVTLVA